MKIWVFQESKGAWVRYRFPLVTIPSVWSGWCGESVTKFEQLPSRYSFELDHDQIGVGFCFGELRRHRVDRVERYTADLQVPPTAHACGTHAEMLGGFSLGCTCGNGGKRTGAKINGKGFRHICRPPSADSLNQNRPNLQSPERWVDNYWISALNQVAALTAALQLRLKLCRTA